MSLVSQTLTLTAQEFIWERVKGKMTPASDSDGRELVDNYAQMEVCSHICPAQIISWGGGRLGQAADPGKPRFWVQDNLSLKGMSEEKHESPRTIPLLVKPVIVF